MDSKINFNSLVIESGYNNSLLYNGDLFYKFDDSCFKLYENKFIERYSCDYLKKLNIESHSLIEKVKVTKPEIFEVAKSIQDKDGNCIFKDVQEFLYFLVLPVNNLKVQRRFGQSPIYSLPDDIESFLNENLQYLLSIRQLCKNIPYYKHINDYMIALKYYNVDFKQLTEIDLNQHPKEVAFLQHFPSLTVENATRALILMVDPRADHNSATDIHVSREFYKQFSLTCGVSFKVFKNTEHIEMEIKKHKFDYLILVAHASESKIFLSEDEEKFIDENSLKSETFENLNEAAKIFLLCCSTGKELAQKIANLTHRTVFAPNYSIAQGQYAFQDGRFVSLNVQNIEEKILEFLPEM